MLYGLYCMCYTVCIVCIIWYVLYVLYINITLYNTDQTLEFGVYLRYNIMLFIKEK